MTATLSGRATRTLITSLELLSDDETQVLMLDRQEDGSIVIKVRAPYESTWSASGPRYEVKAADARHLSQLFGSQDIYSSSYLDDIPAKKISRDKPREVIEAELAQKPAECTELDIERAKAANLEEQQKVLRVELDRDHGRGLHDNNEVESCVMCQNRIRPGYGDGSRREPVDSADIDTNRPTDDEF